MTRSQASCSPIIAWLINEVDRGRRPRRPRRGAAPPAYPHVVVAIAILVSAAAIKGGDSGGTDEFIARHAWLYVAIVTADYLISRGLAESGSRTPYWEDSGQNRSRNGTSSDHRARERAASAWGPVWRGARGRPATDTGAAASISRGAGRERR